MSQTSSSNNLELDRQLESAEREISALKLQRDQLQAKCTAQLMELRALKEGRTTISGQVEAFMHLFDQPVGKDVGWPRLADGSYDQKTIRLGMRLVIEEAFEFLEAMITKSGDRLAAADLKAHKEDVLGLIGDACLNLSDAAFIEAADALGDLDYVSEWSRLAFGVLNSKLIADEIQRSNVAKVGGTKDPTTGKKQKPPGWSPPDIRKALMQMGWEPREKIDG